MSIIQGGLNPVVAAANNAAPRVSEPQQPDPVVKRVKPAAHGGEASRYAENKARDDDLRGQRVDIDA